MDTSWLEDFLVLAEAANFSRAAAQRNVTQPAFSRRIRALESWAGVPLFDRSNHPVVLTEAGRHFLPFANDLLRRIVLARDETQEIGEAASNALRFAATHVLSLTFFPSWLRSLEARLHVGPVQLISDSLLACEDVMLRGQAQFLLCHHHEKVRNRLDPKEFQSIKINTDVVIPVTANDASGRPQFAIPEAGTAPPILAYSTQSGLGRIVRTHRDADAEPGRFEPVFTSHLATVLKTMALDGRGIAWLPQSLIRDELDTGRLAAAGGREWNISVEIHLFRRQRQESAAAEAFWHAVAQSV